MILYNESKWKQLPLTDYRCIFFIQAFSEYLSINTPHFYQARLMNIVSCSTEVLESMDDYLQKEKNLSNLKNAIEELKDCILNDVVAHDTFRELIISAKKIINKCLVEKPNRTELNRLKIVCQSILRKKNLYKSHILRELRKAVVGIVELAQKPPMLG